MKSRCTSNLNLTYKRINVCVLLVVFVASCLPALGQLSDRERSDAAKAAQKRGLYLLDRIRVALENDYYDQSFGGIDLATRIKKARESIKLLSDQEQVYLAVSQFLLDLNDSHTFVSPPTRRYLPEYGYRSMMVGDRCYVTYVKKGSDAEIKGLRRGDEIVSIGTVKVTRENFSRINFIIYSLKPQRYVELTVNGVDGKARQLTIQADAVSRKDVIKEFDRAKNEERLQPYTCKDLSDNVEVCKLRTFLVEDFDLNGLLNAASKKKKLILDLRGNSGGFLGSLSDLVGHFFDREVLICTDKTKRGNKDRFAKVRKNDAFKGELAVLIDSRTGSAAEIFARVIQIEKRGTVYGDVSSGSVMAAVSSVIQIPEYPGQTGGNIFFATVSVTVSDVIMSDGKRLENIGVIPDFPLGPSGFAISRNMDPVLSIAAKAMGVDISPQDAGNLHFLIPRRDDAVETDETTVSR